MRRIIITAILTVICAVGAVTSFAVNDLPNMMDGNNHMMPQDGMGPNNGQHMHQNGQNQMMPQDGMGPNNGQHMHSNGQMPPQGQMPMQGQPPQQPNGNAPQQQTDQGAPQTTQN